MKHWVFDLDGTLVDSFSHFFDCLKEIFNDYGLAFTDDLRLPALTESLPLFFETHLGKAAVAPAFERLQHISRKDATRIKPFSGVEDFLADLRADGCRIGIWTNRDFESASLIANHSGLQKYIDEFVSGTCTVLRKPHPEGLNRIIESFKTDPKNVIMVGDHEHDVIAAKTAGARGVRVSWHSYWKVDPCSHAELHFHDFAHFTRWAGER